MKFFYQQNYTCQFSLELCKSSFLSRLNRNAHHGCYSSLKELVIRSNGLVSDINFCISQAQVHLINLSRRPALRSLIRSRIKVPLNRQLVDSDSILDLFSIAKGIPCIVLHVNTKLVLNRYKLALHSGRKLLQSARQCIIASCCARDQLFLFAPFHVGSRNVDFTLKSHFFLLFAGSIVRFFGNYLSSVTVNTIRFNFVGTTKLNTHAFNRLMASRVVDGDLELNFLTREKLILV